MTSYDEARKAGRRVFYETETETLRQCPENYLLAMRVYKDGRGWRWITSVDKASHVSWRKLRPFLERRHNLAGEVTAMAVGEAFFPARKGVSP